MLLCIYIYIYIYIYTHTHTHTQNRLSWAVQKGLISVSRFRNTSFACQVPALCRQMLIRCKIPWQGNSLAFQKPCCQCVCSLALAASPQEALNPRLVGSGRCVPKPRHRIDWATAISSKSKMEACRQSRVCFVLKLYISLRKSRCTGVHIQTVTDIYAGLRARAWKSIGTLRYTA